MVNQNAVGLAIGLILAGIGGFIVMEAATDEEFQQYIEDSEAWCDAHDGELHNAQVIGEHGGLHCELPNGTSVHMHEVADYNFTHDWSEMDDDIIDPYEDQPWYMIGMMPVLLLTTGVGLVGGIFIRLFG